MNDRYNHYLHARVTTQHIDELLANAAEERRARLARGPRPVRRRLGRLLISAGVALIDQPLDVAIPESG